jgi:hypothetical protein
MKKSERKFFTLLFVLFFMILASVNLRAESSKEQNNLDKTSKADIKKALETLKDPMNGFQAAKFLRTVKNRKMIYPKLVEMIKTDHKFLVVNAIKAMSDDTAESVKLQMELFDQNKYRSDIIRNLKHLSTPIPHEPLLKLFDNKEPHNLPDYFIEILAAMNNSKVTKALIAKANEFFTIKKIKHISKNGIERNPKFEQRPEMAYRHLIQSLASSDSMNALEPLIRIINNARINGRNYGCRMVEDAGTSVEFITNHYFGFQLAFKRDRKPQFERPDPDLSQNPYGKAKNNLRTWLEKNKNKNYQDIVYAGFKKAGYRILPISDSNCLEELIDGLSDNFKPVRYHSYRELEKRTGISFKPMIGRDPGASAGDYGEIITFYQNWYQQNKKNLKFNRKTGQFKIND